MYKLIRIFNQNRKLFIMVLIIILAIYIGLILINHFVKLQNEEKMKQALMNQKAQIGTEGREFEIAGGVKREQETYKEEKLVIDKFIQYCNNKKFEEAYNLLTKDCKEVLFPNLDKFVKDYGETIFSTVKNYNIQAWKGNIYRVKIMEDLLANGKTAENNFIEQYYSVYGEKLNISNYIATNKYNKMKEKANVNVAVEKIDYYIDDAIAKVKVTNNRDTSIMLNTRDYADNIYLLDDNNIKYISVLNEVFDEEFIIAPKQTKEISIKLSIPYTKIDNVISFNIDSMISNYEQYVQTGNFRVIQFKIML